VNLKRIVLRDFVIVQALDLDLHGGFTILTGETGAGKSILIDALQLVTGGRADTGLIREGAQRTEVSAEFDSNAAIHDWLNSAGFMPDESLLLRRTLDSQGKSRGWINGSPCTAAQLRELGEQLLDIHGQHAWQSLTRADAVRDLLDDYAGLQAHALEPAWRRWREAQEQLDHAKISQSSLQRERERLQWQIGELEKLAPLDDEWPELNQEHTRLSHAQALIDAAQRALDALDQGEPHASGQVSLAQEVLQRQAAIEPRFQSFCEVLSSALAQVEDAAHSLRAYLRHADLDPDRLQLVDERMGQWMSLAKRYRSPPEDLPQLLKSWHAQLAELEANANVQGLEKQVTDCWDAYAKQAETVSQTRHAHAPVLAQAITEAMQGLGMTGGRFEVALTPANQPLQSGLEDVAFLVAGHAGSTPRPVNKVASGGELSRLALAIAVTTSRNGQAGTLIFDEIDAGVGGSVAETVGQRMRQLGQDRQVLAVTHLPQVAACADHHLVVSKQLQGTVTLSSVHPVQQEDRVQELARMLSGERQLASTLTHARELLMASGVSP
jgi:DNA repair protein RecN (Recombination protein N)